jgi:CheY-like chemotaxis protein
MTTNIPKIQLGDLLVTAGIITVRTLERALERQKGSGKRLGIVLEEMGVLTGDELVTALARQMGCKTVKNIVDHGFPPELLALVPEDVAVLKQVFPLRKSEDTLALAISDPFDNDTLDFLAKRNNVRIVPVLSTRDDIMAAVNKFYLHGNSETFNVVKILVVEDSPSVATIIRVALQKEGYDVYEAHDGIEGLKLAMTHKPTLIVCDGIMPRLDGFGLKRAVDGNPQLAGTPMILLTSKASGEDEQKALEAGFIDFIPKPVQPIRVVSRVRHALSMMKNMR